MTTQHEFLDTAIQKMGNRYITTMLIAKRIRQLQHGARARVQRQEEESYFSVAVREIAAGLLTLEEHAETTTTQHNGSTDDGAAVPDTPPEA